MGSEDNIDDDDDVIIEIELWEGSAHCVKSTEESSNKSMCRHKKEKGKEACNSEQHFENKHMLVKSGRCLVNHVS